MPQEIERKKEPIIIKKEEHPSITEKYLRKLKKCRQANTDRETRVNQEYEKNNKASIFSAYYSNTFFGLRKRTTCKI